MGYDTILARSFTRNDQKKFGCGGIFIVCLFIGLSFFTYFKPCLGPLPLLNLRLSAGSGLKLLTNEEMSNPQRTSNATFANKLQKEQGKISTLEKQRHPSPAETDNRGEKNTTHQSRKQTNQKLTFKRKYHTKTTTKDIKTQEEVKPICDVSEPMTDVCEMNGEIRIHGKNSSIFFASTQTGFSPLNSSSWTVRPYARKSAKDAMAHIREFTITTSVTPPQEILQHCNINHTLPAVVFSTGGFSGNFFHAFADVIIPLYLTSRQFDGQVQFLVSTKKTWWIDKFQSLFHSLSRYDIIDIDKEDNVHCFPRMIVGLKHHKELHIDPSRSSYSMRDFRQFLRSSYSLERASARKLVGKGGKRPRILIISRTGSRTFMNQGKIVDVATSLGYEVVVTEADSNVSRFAQLVNSCDVMMGVHGAGLTNMVFLPENAVLIQVVPLGTEWVSRTYFGETTKDMNLRYLEYKISENESSLIDQYPLDHEVFRNRKAVVKGGWSAFKSVYLDKQSVKLDLRRFRKTLLQALKLLRA